MKNIKIIIFSGTGNTKHVADLLGQCLKKDINKIKILNVDKANASEMDLTDSILILGFPVYLFRAPEIINKFIDTLPYQNISVPCFIFTTKAWASGNSVYLAAKKLKKNNFIIVGNKDFICPSNGWLTFFDKNHILSRITRVEKDISENINNFADTIVHTIKGNNIKSKKLRRKPLFEIFRLFGKKIEHNLYKNINIDYNKCINCKKCINLCPVNKFANIDDKVVIQSNIECMQCMRCISYCPVECINFGIKTIGKPRYNNKLREKYFGKESE